MSTTPPSSSKHCPNCSESISAEFAYCPVCGHSTSISVNQPPILAPIQVRPETVVSTGSLSRKQWGWVAAFVGFVVFVAALISVSHNQSGGATSDASPQPISQQNTKIQTDFERAEQYFENGSYLAASDIFEKVNRDDPKYADAQAKLKIVKQKLAEQEQQEKKKEVLKKQYQKLCNSRLYLFEIEERLQRENFYMDQSQFEKAPDGSDGVRRYFSKTTSDGHVIKIWLQSGYSNAYYCVVEVR